MKIETIQIIRIEYCCFWNPFFILTIFRFVGSDFDATVIPIQYETIIRVELLQPIV